MLAAHRDQENLAHSHQVTSKQQPKTPGARNPKTPSRRNDENAPTAFAGKLALGGAKMGGNENILMTKGKGAKQSVMTPMGQTTRAPLGNKTTNAKARTGQAGGVKGMVNQIEKTQLKPTAQKPKQKAPELAPAQIEIKHDHDSDDEEPEYAPPSLEPLPYESDLLPKGGLTFEGLKKENMMRGFYEHFVNPVDDEGVSRREKRFNEEMERVMDRAVQKNNRDLKEFDWGLAEPETLQPQSLKNKRAASETAQVQTIRRPRGLGQQNPPSTFNSRKAAMALAGPPTLKKAPGANSTSNATVRRPLSSFVKRKPAPITPRSTAPLSGTGQAASRTTMGYSKGKAASSLVHSRGSSHSTLSRPARTKTPVFRDEDKDLTITPARAREAGFGSSSSSRPQFMDIFDAAEDDEDLPPMTMPQMSDDEGEEGFELKLDV